MNLQTQMSIKWCDRHFVSELTVGSVFLLKSSYLLSNYKH